MILGLRLSRKTKPTGATGCPPPRPATGDLPLLDWLKLFGGEKGYEQDAVADPRTDFQEFVFRKGREFEAAVIEHLATIEPVFAITSGVEAVTSLDACRETFEAMRRGEPIIHQGVLRNPENRTYGAADILVRSDVLHRIFPKRSQRR